MCAQGGIHRGAAKSSVSFKKKNPGQHRRRARHGHRRDSSARDRTQGTQEQAPFADGDGQIFTMSSGASGSATRIISEDLQAALRESGPSPDRANTIPRSDRHRDVPEGNFDVNGDASKLDFHRLASTTPVPCGSDTSRRRKIRAENLVVGHFSREFNSIDRVDPRKFDWTASTASRISYVDPGGHAGAEEFLLDPSDSVPWNTVAGPALGGIAGRDRPRKERRSLSSAAGTAMLASGGKP